MLNATDREQSEFNMAVSYLNRINFLFYETAKCSKELDAHNWFHTLVVLFRELSTEMKSKELEEYNAKIPSIAAAVAKNNNQCMRTGKFEIPQTLYLTLHEFELFLRRIMRESGLQNKMKDDPANALM